MLLLKFDQISTSLHQD